MPCPTAGLRIRADLARSPRPNSCEGRPSPARGPPASLSVPGSLLGGRRAAWTPRQRPVLECHRPERAPPPRFGRASAPVAPGEVPGRSWPPRARPGAFVRALGFCRGVGRPCFSLLWGRARAGGRFGVRRRGGGRQPKVFVELSPLRTNKPPPVRSEPKLASIRVRCEPLAQTLDRRLRVRGPGGKTFKLDN